MPKRTKKLLVYLDQNFLSEISKADVNASVRPEFKQLYRIIKTGFQEEKLVVPQSHFHDLETSFAPSLKEQIVRFQNFMGQVELHHPLRVQEHQIGRSLQSFLGEDKDPLGIKVAFRDDPDKRVASLNITIDSHLERQDLLTGRLKHAASLETLRQEIIQEGVTFADQLEREFVDHERWYLKRAFQNYGHLATEQQLVDFGRSAAFRRTPLVSISARLNASILTSRTRTIKTGDPTDIDVLSTFLLYMDIVGTDHYMSTLVKALGIDREYEVKIYGGKTPFLREFIAYLGDYVTETPRVHCPAVSVFVLPTPDIKEHAFEFYRTIGLAAKALRYPEYAEVYGFDDGSMPQYELRHMPGRRLRFYGLMDVTPLPYQMGMSLEETLAICREHCKSDQFVLIDKYQELTEHFFDFVLLSIKAKQQKAQGYAMYPANPG